jgi:hypothetical protein
MLPCPAKELIEPKPGEAPHPAGAKVLGNYRRLTAAAAIVDFQEKQFTQEHKPLWLLRIGQERKDIWPPSGLPRSLEIVADPIDVLDRCERQRIIGSTRFSRAIPPPLSRSGSCISLSWFAWPVRS